MRIEVGRVYVAEAVNDPEFEDMTWQVQIVAEVYKDGARWFVGLVNKDEPTNQTARLFNECGEQPDLSEYALGFRLISLSRAKPQWGQAARGKDDDDAAGGDEARA